MAVYRVRSIKERFVQFLAAILLVYIGGQAWEAQQEVALVMIGLGVFIGFMSFWRFEKA